MARLINFLLYQAGWFACVLGAAWAFPWQGMLIALLLTLVHFGLTTEPATQLRLAMVAGVTGLLVDTTLLVSGAVAFPHGVVTESLPPPWMSVLWIQFATTFRYSMRWLSGHYVAGASFGLFGAPIAFFAGEKLGAIEFLAPKLPHYTLLAVLWAIAIPLLIYVSDRLARRHHQLASYRWFRGQPQERRDVPRV